MTDASLLILFTADMKAWQKEPQRYWQNAPKEVAELLVNWMGPFHEGREWVSLPNTASSPPPKYKTAFVTWIGVFVCVSTLGYFLAPYLAGLPYLLRQAIMTGLVVILLAYVVMPRLTRLFHGWLHKR